MQHFLTIDALGAARLDALLRVALDLKSRRRAGITEHVLAGKTLAMIFEKPSLRTRVSFEAAMTELGGRAMYIRGEEIGIGKREALQDVAAVMGRMVQGLMGRVFRHETVVGLSQHAGVPVINGLCDRHHPCQALGDLLTIREHFGTTKDLSIVFVGDGNNVARSLAQACVLGGSRFTLACPPGYGFAADELAAFGPSVREINDPEQAVAGAQVLYSDVWTSMGQEAEQAKRLRDFHGYQINERLMQLAGRPKVMHCLPAHRGEEITDGAMDHPDSIVYDQAENRLHAQKAILRVLMARDGAALLG
jgi:ornithine carbamoyltransferase